MDISGFSSLSVGTTENSPRQRNTAESLPSLSQLRMLYEEALEEDLSPAPEPEAFDEPDEPEPFDGPALMADIPSLAQLTALRSESARALERRPSSPVAVPPRGRAPERPVRRQGASPVVPRQKTAARYVRAVPVQPKREAAPQENPLRRAVPRPVPAEPRPAYAPESRPAPAEEPRPTLSAQDLPTLTQLSFLREEAKDDVLQDQDRINTEELAPPAAPVAAPAPRSADALPSLEDLRALRSASLREQEPLRQTEPVRQAAAVKEPLPAREPEPVRRPAPREAAEPAPGQSKPAKSRLEMLPTLAQLKAQLEEENLYGNLAFQDSVRQIKQVLTEEPAKAEEAKKPEPPAPAPRRRSDGPQKVGYISYEEFLRDEEFDDFSGYSKNNGASAARKGRTRGYAERADVPAPDKHSPQTEEFGRDEEDASVKKKLSQKIPIWINSLLRSS